MRNCRIDYENVQVYRQSANQCFVSCALTAVMNTTSSSLDATVDTLTSALGAQFIANGETELASVVTNAILRCINVAVPVTAKILEQEKFICDPNALLIRGCIRILLAANCPENRQINQAGCMEWRNYWKNCKAPNIF